MAVPRYDQKFSAENELGRIMGTGAGNSPFTEILGILGLKLWKSATKFHLNTVLGCSVWYSYAFLVEEDPS